MRPLAAVVPLAVVVLAGCGGGGNALSTPALVSALRDAGFQKVEVYDMRRDAT